MSQKNNYHIIHSGRKWVIKEEGNPNPIIEKDSKREAILEGAQIAKEHDVELILHDDLEEVPEVENITERVAEIQPEFGIPDSYE